MKLTRRTFTTGLVASASGLLMPQRLAAQLTLGDATLTTVSDGNLVLPVDMIFGGLPQDELKALTERHAIDLTQYTPPCNVTLLQSGDRTVLFDVGSGSEFMPTAGELATNLEAAGVDLSAVTDIVITHGHPDHIWGLLDDFGDPLFPDAAIHIGRVEWDYWTDPETVNTIDAGRQSFAVGAKRRLEGLEAPNLFEDGDEVLPGIHARATYGHTLGHMAFEIDAGGTSAMVLGDAVGNGHVAFYRPGWASGSDQDAETGAATRVALMDRLAADGIVVSGFHLPDGGIGRVMRDTDGYRFEAAV